MNTLAAIVCIIALADSTRTPHFVVTADNLQMANRLSMRAEELRNRLAIEWLGKPLPAWSGPCLLRIVNNQQASGVTRFTFTGNEVHDFDMQCNGSFVEIWESVLPHEILHTVLASHFRRPLPRWVDEGACCTVESMSEIAGYRRRLIDYLKTDRGIPFNTLFALKKYPERDTLAFYSHSYSLVQFLLTRGSRQDFVQYVTLGLACDNWPHATRHCYGYENLSAMQDAWLAWVRAGSPSEQLVVGVPTR